MFKTGIILTILLIIFITIVTMASTQEKTGMVSYSGVYQSIVSEAFVKSNEKICACNKQTAIDKVTEEQKTIILPGFKIGVELTQSTCNNKDVCQGTCTWRVNKGIFYKQEYITTECG